MPYNQAGRPGGLYPRMLLILLVQVVVLVLEVESPRGDILALFAKIKRRLTAESAY